MSLQFLKIKRKIRFETILKCSAVSLSLGILVSSILIIIYKSLGLEYNLLYFILIGLGVFIVFNVVLFLIFNPSDVKVAKRIDKQLNLKEKIHTMVEYEDKNGPLVGLQRKDAEDKLASISIKKFKMKFSYYLLILPLMALAMCATSIIIKAKEPQQPPIEEPISGDPYAILQIRIIIREVEANNVLMPAAKEAFVSHLEELIDNVNVENITRNQEVSFVNQTITEVSNSSSRVNSIDEIILALKNSNNEDMHALGIAISEYSAETMNSSLDTIRAYLVHASPSERRRRLEEYNAEGFDLIANERLEATDEMNVFFVNLQKNLTTAIESQTYNDDILQVIETAKSNLEAVVIKQKETLVVANYIEQSLIEIFQLPNNDETPVNPAPPIGGVGDETTEEGNGGGGGSGDIIFAGDDLFYDPDGGLLPYYEVISKYMTYIDGLIADGVIDEELRGYYVEYFNSLYNAKKES